MTEHRAQKFDVGQHDGDLQAFPSSCPQKWGHDDLLRPTRAWVYPVCWASKPLLQTGESAMGKNPETTGNYPPAPPKPLNPATVKGLGATAIKGSNK